MRPSPVKSVFVNPTYHNILNRRSENKIHIFAHLQFSKTSLIWNLREQKNWINWVTPGIAYSWGTLYLDVDAAL